MSKKRKDKSPESFSPRIVNRRAFHDYHISEKIECGMVLRGSEVKSIRNGLVSLAEGYARVEPGGELKLWNVDIAHYPQAGENQHEPKRPRRLLAHRRQIAQLEGKTSGKGVTLVPLALYFVRGKAKIELGLAEGKRAADKRQDLKKREADREMRRGMTRRVI